MTQGPAEAAVKQGLLQQLAQQGAQGTPVFGIEVTNDGRQPLSVVSWNISCVDSGIALIVGPDSFGPKLPHKLDASTSERWYVPLRDAIALAQTPTVLPGRRAEPLRVTANLGNGTSASSATPVDVTVLAGPES